MEAIIFSVSYSAIAFLAFMLLRYFDNRLTISFGFLFTAYVGLDDLATSLPSLLHFARFIDGEWNWSGKIYSLLLSTVAILLLRVKAKALGLTLTQRNITQSLIALFFLTLMSFSLGLAFNQSYPTMETIAFQALMPGLAEELVYRGIAPAMLLGLIHGKDAPQQTPWAVVLITSIAFCVWHGLSYSDEEFYFDAISATPPFIGSIAYGWLRFNSGSLLFPILAHGLGNTAFHLTALI